jgi:hypothetical protein
VVIPDSVLLVEFSAFASCFSLEGVKLSLNMGMIDESLFEGCRALKTVDLPPKLYKIGRRAFKGCSSLTGIILPVTLKEIGFDAFASCRSLKGIAIPRGLSEIEDSDAFGGCDSLSEITFGGTKEEWEMLNRGRTLSVQRSDLSFYSPKVHFLGLKNEV